VLGNNVMHLRVHAQGTVDSLAQPRLTPARLLTSRQPTRPLGRACLFRKANRDYVRERLIQIMDGTQKNGALG